MKKINLEQEDSLILERFAKSNSSDVKVIKKIFDFYINDLRDVRNIDPKGNMGLQALGAQLALTNLDEIRDLIFGTPSSDTAEGKPTISQYR